MTKRQEWAPNTNISGTIDTITGEPAEGWKDDFQFLLAWEIVQIEQYLEAVAQRIQSRLEELRRKDPSMEKKYSANFTEQQAIFEQVVAAFQLEKQDSEAGVLSEAQKLQLLAVYTSLTEEKFQGSEALYRGDRLDLTDDAT